MSTIHICAPKPETVSKRICFCPTCGRRRAMLVRTYEWYGPLVTCLGCGEEWSDGQRCERPFARGWREKNVANAKKILRSKP